MEPIRRLGLVRRGVFERGFAVVCLRLSSVELYLPPISVLAAPQPTATLAAPQPTATLAAPQPAAALAAALAASTLAARCRRHRRRRRSHRRSRRGHLRRCCHWH